MTKTEIKRLKKLPIYDCDDSHDEAEWIAIGYDGEVWHQIGGHVRSLPENLQAEFHELKKLQDNSL